MASDSPRWRNIREFLDDLPKEHCHSKPDHEFCTVCMRINYIIAQDCPLFHLRPKRKKAPMPSYEGARTEPVKERLSADDVKQALKGEDFPIIEFAGPRGTGAGAKEEGIFEVKPIDVKPIVSPPPSVKRKAAVKEAPEEEPAETRPATAVTDRDPESIVQEIMEELEFPDTEEQDMDEDEEEGEAEKGDEEETEEADGDEEPEKPDGPPVVKKEAVRKVRPKDK